MASNNVPHRRESRARRMVKRLRDRSEISPFYKYVLFFTNFLFLVSCTSVVPKGILNMKCHTHELNFTKITFLEIFLHQLHLLAEFYLCSAIRCVELEVSHSCTDFHQDKFDRFFYVFKAIFFFLRHRTKMCFHQILTWTTGSLMCVCDLFACVYARGTSVYTYTSYSLFQRALYL